MNKSAPELFNASNPRDDILEGNLEGEQFAASIGAVSHDPEETLDIYSEARDFFEKTYPTAGLKELLQHITKGILDHEGEEENISHSKILGLDTTFGGGRS